MNRGFQRKQISDTADARVRGLEAETKHLRRLETESRENLDQRVPGFPNRAPASAVARFVELETEKRESKQRTGLFHLALKRAGFLEGLIAQVKTWVAQQWLRITTREAIVEPIVVPPLEQHPQVQATAPTI